LIDPDDPPDVQIAKQAKIIDALIRRSHREHDVGRSAYSLFQSAITLQGEVWEKTRDLKVALDTLGRASNELQSAQSAREQSQRNLAEALDAMEGGFALFRDQKLEIFNELFRTLIPQLSGRLVPGLDLDGYFQAIGNAVDIRLSHDGSRPISSAAELQGVTDRKDHFVVELEQDRWFQVSHKQTSSNTVVVLQAEITEIVRENRSEKNRLKDAHADLLQAAFDHMSQGVCILSDEGRLLIHNAPFGDLLGLPFPLTHKGTHLGQILNFIEKQGLFDTTGKVTDWEKRLGDQGKLSERVRHKSGVFLDIQAHGLPDGGIIINVLDVTAQTQTTEMLEGRVLERTTELTAANVKLRRQRDDQSRVEEKLRVAKEQAEAAVSSKTRFLAAASHDLLQPINAAKLLISTLSEQAQDTEMNDSVERLDRSFNSVESLLHALLDISRLDSVQTELAVTSFPLNEILSTVTQDYAQVASDKGLSLDVVGTSVWVKSDARYLLRSIQNLVVNAIQYTSHGRILLGCRRRGDTVRVEVWDTGIGISKTDQERVFAEFTRVGSDNAGSGMGLGLSIVERACRHLKHPVYLRSKPGVGSVFSIDIPVAEPEPQQSELPGTNVIIHNDLDLIVLIVENDVDVLFATTQRLEGWGASVLGAGSTAEALTLVEDIGMAPDILLVDYQLDDNDNGIETIHAIRKYCSTHVPAIMITATRDDSLHDQATAHDFTILTKPVQLSRMRPLIDWKTRVRAAE